MKMHLIFLTNRQERQERQGKSLREFGAASQRNGITNLCCHQTVMTTNQKLENVQQSFESALNTQHR